MIAPRWIKALRDLWANKARTLVVVLAVAIGVCGVGSVLSAYTILTREMDTSFAATKPASAILTLRSVPKQTLEIAESHPGISVAEARGGVRGRIKTGPDTWRVIELFVVPDISRMRVSVVEPEAGRFKPGAAEIVLERSSLKLFDPGMGTDVTVRADGVERSLGYVGTVHDAGEAPAWMEGLLYGYIDVSTAESFGIEPLTQIRLRAEGQPTEAEIRELAYEVKREIGAAGAFVTRVEILKPGVHPHSSQMKTLLFLLEAFGMVALLLSCVMVASLVSSMMSRQVREIGAMKAIGATSWQVAGVYAAGVALLGLLAAMLGIPLAVAAGRGYARFAMGILNFDIVSDTIPLWVFAVQAAVGILTPLAVAALPIARGASVTVRSAVNDTGLTVGSRATARIEAMATRMRGLGRPSLLAVRNVVRRPARLALAVATLALGGAGFMAAMSAGASWTRTVDSAWDSWGWDLDAALSVRTDVKTVGAALAGVDGVDRLELWVRESAVAIRRDGTDGEAVTVFAEPSDSTVLDPQLLSGRWLQPSDDGSVVVTHMLAEREGVVVGDRVSLRMSDGSIAAWNVVGVVKEIGPPVAYVQRGALERQTGVTGGNLVRIVSESRDEDSVAALSAQVERAFHDASMPVAMSVSMLQRKQALVDHVFIFVSLLTIMSALIVLVGGLGLVSTTSVNVMDRIRELGVLQAIGATTSQVVRLFVVEGVVVSVLSWLVAVGLSVPLAGAISKTGGDIFIQAPIDPAYSFAGAVGWLVFVVVLGMVASAGPALRASRRAVRETLVYQ